MVGLPFLFRFPPVMKRANSVDRRPNVRLCTSALWVLTLLGGVAAFPSSASAQFPDTYMVGGGVLQWFGFEPSYRNWLYRFNADGVEEPLGLDLSFDSTSSNFYPTMSQVERALWSITGDTTFGLTAGSFRTELSADVRRFPFKLKLGLSDRLTFTATVPIVTTRMQVDFQVDSSANVGWNQASPISGGEASAVPQMMALLGQLEASAAALEATISSGGLDCPGGPSCDAARDLVIRVRDVANELIAFTGVGADGDIATVLPPYAPLATSDAGSAIAAAIQAISLELEAFGAPEITETVPLPSNPISPDSVQTVLTETTAGFGYDAEPLEFVKYKEKLGDLELGLRFGLMQRPSMRAVLSTKVRLPTGMRDSPDNYVDIGTGDGQTDIEAGLDFAFEPGKVVGLAISARYNMQMGDQLVRRLALPNQPIAITASKQTVSRNLGDVLSVSLFPTLRLDNSFRAFTSIHYYRKGADTYSGNEFVYPWLTTVRPSDLAVGTEMSSISVGAGIHFRSSGRDGITKLPAEAGIHYYATYQGSGGFTPKASGVRFYLRLFRRLWGGEEPVEQEVEPAEEPVER